MNASLHASSSIVATPHLQVNNIHFILRRCSNCNNIDRGGTLIVSDKIKSRNIGQPQQ